MLVGPTPRFWNRAFCKKIRATSIKQVASFIVRVPQDVSPSFGGEVRIDNNGRKTCSFKFLRVVFRLYNLEILDHI